MAGSDSARAIRVALALAELEVAARVSSLAQPVPAGLPLPPPPPWQSLALPPPPPVPAAPPPAVPGGRRRGSLPRPPSPRRGRARRGGSPQGRLGRPPSPVGRSRSPRG
eukprot:7095212-Heterocapsa_arctica.AAC.1